MYPLQPSIVDAAFLDWDRSFQATVLGTKTIWQRLATLRMSTTEQTVRPWLDVLPELEEMVGPLAIDNLSLRTQTLVNKKFARAFQIPREKFEDDTYKMYGDALMALGKSSAQLPDKQVVAALKAGSSALVYDGQPFFDTDHPVNMDKPSSPTQANFFDYSTTGAGGSQAGLTAVNMADAIAKGESLVNAAGVPFEVDYDLCVCPPQLAFQARTIFKESIIAMPVGTSGTSPGGAAGQGNALQGTADVLKVRRLSDQPNYLYMFATSEAVKPLIWQQRTAPEFTYRNNPQDPIVFENDMYVGKVRARGAAGYGPWWMALKIKVAADPS